MELVLVRHAIAEELDPLRKPIKRDDERVLTEEGIAKMKKAAKGLHAALEEVDLIATSKLIRAQQTAEILAKEFVKAEVVFVESLSPDGRKEHFLKWLHTQNPRGRIMTVGHEPSLSIFAGFFLSSAGDPLIQMKKGGAAMIGFSGAPYPGGGELRWLLPPKILRRLGE